MLSEGTRQNGACLGADLGLADLNDLGQQLHTGRDGGRLLGEARHYSVFNSFTLRIYDPVLRILVSER